MKTPLVSVIIPVYNGKDYIQRCVESVINQTHFDYQDVEILLLNDGSSDASLAEIKKLHSMYPDTIKVYDQQNMGVANTRNKGIKLATGVYTVFIDQDDYIDTDYLRTFYDAAEDGLFDIVVGGYKRPDETGKIIRNVDQPCTDYSVKFKVSAAWAKIHRTAFLHDYDILFYDNAFGEDILFTMQENANTTKVKGIHYSGYNWFWNSGSVSNTQQRSLLNQSKIRRLIDDMLPLTVSATDAYYLVQTGVYYLLYSGKFAKKADFISLYNYIFTAFEKKRVLSSKNNVYFGPSGVSIPTKIAVGLFVLLHKLKLIPLFASVYCKNPRIN